MSTEMSRAAHSAEPTASYQMHQEIIMHGSTEVTCSNEIPLSGVGVGVLLPQ